MKLISNGAGYHPGTGLDLPKAGVAFEAADDKGAELIAAGLATASKAKDKDKKTEEDK